MLKKIQEFVEKYNMIDKGDGIVLGVSGGADSVSLFYAMLELKKIYQTRLAVVHVNHGIRGADADQDEEYVRRLCQENQIPFTAVHKNVVEEAKRRKMSEEEAGRQIRYQAFYQVMKQYHFQKTAVAHNKNDLSETVLLNLFRGTGIKGLGGIEPVRGKIIRPLLCVERSEIENYLEEMGIQYQNDISNQQDKYTRNKIRRNVLPYIKENINEQVTAHIASAAGILLMTNDYMEQEAGKAFQDLVSRNGTECSFDTLEFGTKHPAIQTMVLRKILFDLSGKQKDIEMKHIDIILDILSKGVGKKADLPYGLECVNSYGKTIIRRKEREKKERKKTAMELSVPGSFNVPECGISIDLKLLERNSQSEDEIEKLCKNPQNDYTKVFDYDKIRNTILLRNRRTGDYFQCDSRGGTKKLKEFFVNEKVPAEKRNQILLLADGSHIIWIVGFRISEYYKIDKKTKRILYVNINGGERHGRQN